MSPTSDSLGSCEKPTSVSDEAPESAPQRISTSSARPYPLYDLKMSVEPSHSWITDIMGGLVFGEPSLKGVYNFQADYMLYNSL